MARCPKCRSSFRTLEDEEGMHACPFCNYHPSDEDDSACYHCGEEEGEERFEGLCEACWFEEKERYEGER